ncbi:MAG TPA: hypothetical protein VKA18_13090 [Alphaproteobacteria bacterium]|nr:hypothetical protein [Alphaproteobacteria bacterium]
MRKYLIIAAVAVSSMASANAFAASKVCVSNAGGYVMNFALMAEFGGEWVAWKSTGNYPIGQSKCIDTSALPNGTKMYPRMAAILGKHKNCSPTVTKADEESFNYTASGTTLSPHCEIPS